MCQTLSEMTIERGMLVLERTSVMQLRSDGRKGEGRGRQGQRVLERSDPGPARPGPGGRKEGRKERVTPQKWNESFDRAAAGRAWVDRTTDRPQMQKNCRVVVQKFLEPSAGFIKYINERSVVEGKWHYPRDSLSHSVLPIGQDDDATVRAAVMVPTPASGRGTLSIHCI